ncbi:hypothetical protein GCM10007301_09820 [Azorhizobium oxalatiphilum]|uniref:Uncharacterized protein n=1 Tax=Azorhizobium oxalatiphilum TaxID=980631 RepID=A0A917F6F5_9HYPH|nr:hypothetical protein [Azorhizobium oxalatiphilum]GGF52362.1 hypothetical protein GCM10007301_09820 [Azorhizobium oxalatiphilum]
MDDVTLARALHVLAVVHWIGGLAFVTLVVLPLSRTLIGVQGTTLFEVIENRFSGQVRWSVPLAGLSGFWMVVRLDLWDRFRDPAFWWMHAMVILWVLFMLLLFVIEPILHRWVVSMARHAPPATLQRITTMHCALLSIAALTIFGAVAGAHGLFLF